MEKKAYINPEATVIFITEAQHLCEESEWTDEAFARRMIDSANEELEMEAFYNDLEAEEEEKKPKYNFSVW